MKNLVVPLLLAVVGVAAAESREPLKEFEVGSYSEIAARPNPKKLLLVPIPSLAATLLAAQTKKGSPLTKAEVELIRDKATVVASSPESVDSINKPRGYKDIDPVNCWDEWQALRSTLSH
jgi:hypothetical protein